MTQPHDYCTLASETRRNRSAGSGEGTLSAASEPAATSGGAAAYRWTLVTVTYNSASALGEFWGQVTLPSDVEWIVVDNASTDESREVASSLGARVIPLKRNVGFGAANNIGFRSSSSKYVGFVNPDVVVKPEDLPALEREIDVNPRALVAPQLVHTDGSLQANGRGAPTLRAKLRHRFRPDRAEGTYRIYAEFGEKAHVLWLLGAVVAGDRNHLSKYGPWDERYFLYYEDADLGIRNHNGGGVSVVIGDCRWVHALQWKTRGLNLTAWRRALPTMLRFYSRYWPLVLGASRRFEVARAGEPECDRRAPNVIAGRRGVKQ